MLKRIAYTQPITRDAARSDNASTTTSCLDDLITARWYALDREWYAQAHAIDRQIAQQNAFNSAERRTP